MSPEQTRQFIIEQLQEAEFDYPITDEHIDFITNIDLHKCEHNPTKGEEETAFGFSVHDVLQCAAEQMNITLTNTEAATILIRLRSKGDLDVGISWATLEIFIGEFIENTELGKAIDDLGREIAVELSIDEGADREGSTVWTVGVCSGENLIDTIDFYDEAEAKRQMENCEAYFPDVTTI